MTRRMLTLHPRDLFSNRLGAARWGLLVFSVPALMFPLQVPWLTLATIVLIMTSLVWEWRSSRHGLFPATPLMWPVTLLFGMMTIGLAVSPAQSLSLPKFTGVILGLLLLRTILLETRTSLALWTNVALYVASGMLLVLLGVLGADWARKVPMFAALGELAPRRIMGLPGAEHGVNSNAIGGMTLLFLPLLSALTVARWSGRFALTRVAILLPLGGLLGVILASQSRTSWISLVVTVLLGVVVRFRKLRWPMAVAVLAGGAAFVRFGVWQWILEQRHETVLAGSVAEGVISLKSRVEIWSRAIDAISDFAFTGMGPAAFRSVVHVMYPLRSLTPDMEVAHAHNMFLQTALDVGVPGFVAYLTVLSVTGVMCSRVYRHGDALEQALALGLGGNVLAVHIFGLTDAIALGAKVGLYFWWSIGLVAVLYARLPRSTASPLPSLG